MRALLELILPSWCSSSLKSASSELQPPTTAPSETQAVSLTHNFCYSPLPSQAIPPAQAGMDLPLPMELSDVSLTGGPGQSHVPNSNAHPPPRAWGAAERAGELCSFLQTVSCLTSRKIKIQFVLGFCDSWAPANSITSLSTKTSLQLDFFFPLNVTSYRLCHYSQNTVLTPQPSTEMLCVFQSSTLQQELDAV